MQREVFVLNYFILISTTLKNVNSFAETKFYLSTYNYSEEIILKYMFSYLQKSMLCDQLI